MHRILIEIQYQSSRVLLEYFPMDAAVSLKYSLRKENMFLDEREFCSDTKRISKSRILQRKRENGKYIIISQYIK